MENPQAIANSFKRQINQSRATLEGIFSEIKAATEQLRSIKDETVMCSEKLSLVKDRLSSQLLESKTKTDELSFVYNSYNEKIQSVKETYSMLLELVNSVSVPDVENTSYAEDIQRSINNNLSILLSQIETASQELQSISTSTELLRSESAVISKTMRESLGTVKRVIELREDIKKSNQQLEENYTNYKNRLSAKSERAKRMKKRYEHTNT